MKRPNIVIFNPDQMRADSLHHLGNAAAHTPVLDSFVNEAVSFRNAYVQNPVCVPSRCSFMSGQYPHVRGHRTMGHLLQQDEPMLLRDLKRHGYHVWMNERGDMLPAQYPGRAEEYADTIFVPTEDVVLRGGSIPRGQPGDQDYYSFYRGSILTDQPDGDLFDLESAWVQGAVDFIRNRPTDKPFCIFLPIQSPHPPYQALQKYIDKIDPEKIPTRIPSPEDRNAAGKPSMLKGIALLQNLQGYSEKQWTQLRRVYLAMCARVDDLFGRVISALKDEGIWDETAVFFFSDHGDYTGDYGLVEKAQNCFEDCLTNVPLVIKPPRDIGVKSGISEALVELVDFYATVAEMTGLPATHTHFGRSLVPILTGKNATHRETVFCEGGRLKEEVHCSESHQNKQMIAPESEYYPRMKMQASDGPEHTKAAMIRSLEYKYVRRLEEKDEFYNLKNDPSQLTNAIDDPQYRPMIDKMKEAMLDWLLRTADAVPFQADQRIPDRSMIMMMKHALPADEYARVKAALDSGMTLSQLMANAAASRSN